MPNNLKRAIDTDLGCLRTTELKRTMILQNALEGKKVKKKISFVLVLAVILILLMATALAASVWQTFFEPVVSLETENGSFHTWSLQEKLKLLELMRENGIELPEEKMKQLSEDTITNEKKDQIATEIIVERYGREDAISHIDIIEDEKGPMDAWSLEDKAWYSQLMQKHGRLGDAMLNILPDEQDLSRETAVQIAAEALADARGIPLDTLPLKEANVLFFVYPANDVENPRWLVAFEDYPAVLLTASGEVAEDQKLDILTPLHAMRREAVWEQENKERLTRIAQMEKEKGPMHTWSLQDKLVISHNYRLPAEGDLSEKEAVAAAKEALIKAYGLAETDLDQYTPYVWLERGYKNRDKDTWEYWYRIDFGTIDRPHFYGVLMISETGEILETYEPADTLKSSG